MLGLDILDSIIGEKLVLWTSLLMAQGKRMSYLDLKTLTLLQVFSHVFL